MPMKTISELHFAFEEIESILNIIAREDFSCCSNCGNNDIITEIDNHVNETGHRPRGYIFYHRQDLDHLLESGNVYISHGLSPENIPAREEAEEEERILFGNSIVTFFISKGFDVIWDGDTNKRIHIMNIKLNGESVSERVIRMEKARDSAADPMSEM